jgi:HTH-type transcriptional regulator, competence development regulator
MTRYRNISIGKLLGKLRKARGLSYRELANACQPFIDHAYLHRLENGEKSNPSPETIQAIVRGMKVSNLESAIMQAVISQHDAINGDGSAMRGILAPGGFIESGGCPICRP